MSDNDNYLDRIAELTDLDRDEVAETIANMPIEEVDALFDAVAHDQTGVVLAKIANAREDVHEAYYPNVNDKVLVDGKEAVVKHPRGPRNTVGVITDGKLRMVKRRSVKPVTEGVLGVSMMPDLARMRQLAGLSVELPDGTVTAAPAAPEAAPGAFTLAVEDESLPEVMKAFDEIEAGLPSLRLRDAKAVRARITAILARLNESKRPRP